ncbi:MAG TPA: hypothetical protein VGF26_16755, partial [Ramlibacter sp.]
MSIQRPVLLLALLHGFVMAAHAGPQGSPPTSGPSLQESMGEALPAKNAITSVQVDQAADGGWMVTVAYEYTGVPKNARLEIKQQVTQAEANVDPVPYRAAGVALVPGRHRVQLALKAPGDEADRFTQSVSAEMWDMGQTVFASAEVARRFEWPNASAKQLDAEVASKAPQVLIARAIRLIDTDHPVALGQAKALLERLLQRHPKEDQAYVELARVAMKTNWGPDGLRDAEQLIKSALQLRPDSANAKILLGYVHANQRRYRESDALFEQASRTGTSNLWLWTNWGESLLAQGRPDLALKKLHKAVEHPPTKDTNDRARQQAYSSLIRIAAEAGSVEQADALHRQRRAEYPDVVCFGLAHARFLVTVRGDGPGAETVLKGLPSATCDAGDGRLLLTQARYLSWANAKQPQRAEALRLARVAMPVGPQLFYALAESDTTAAAAKQLVGAGEQVTMKDNQGMDALAYALGAGNTAAARRLLAIGARTDALVGPEQMPVALVPVLSADAAGVELMQRAGVDYSQVRFRGMTALQIARQQGDERLVRALTSSPRRL